MPSQPHHAESRFLNVAVALTHAQEELPPAYPWSGDSLLASLQPPRKGPAEELEEALSEYHASAP